MSNNIVERLRELSTPERRKYGVSADVAMDEAADEIDRLRAENERLRAALVAFADHFGPLEDNHMLHKEARRCFALARAALEGKNQVS